MSIIIFYNYLKSGVHLYTGTLSSVDQYIHSSFLWVPEMDGMRK